MEDNNFPICPHCPWHCDLCHHPCLHPRRYRCPYCHHCHRCCRLLRPMEIDCGSDNRFQRKITILVDFSSGLTKALWTSRWTDGRTNRQNRRRIASSSCWPLPIHLRKLVAPEDQGNSAQYKRHDVCESLAVATDLSHAKIKAHLSNPSSSLRRVVIFSSSSSLSFCHRRRRHRRYVIIRHTYKS